jgi:leucyl aminopeptidase
MSIIHATESPAIPLIVLHASVAGADISKLDAPMREWLSANAFKAKAGSYITVPAADGKLRAVVVSVEDEDDLYGLAALPFALPAGHYAVSSDGARLNDTAAVLGWGLGSYEFARYKRPRSPATLVIAESEDTKRARATVAAMCTVRDLVNTPAEDMGPQHLSDAVRVLATKHGARFREIAGDDLLKENFPAIHAVGRASHRAPRIVELEWGDPSHPRIALVGKGVCFDTGGLDIKTADGMRQMKKDMGGAAHVVGIAELIMELKLPVRLHAVIGAVENAIAGNAYRPGDIVPTRKGLQIEIGNTDAEGRVVLSDALTYAAESKPQLIIDFATLTGAARVALGPELPATYANDDAWFAKLDAASKQSRDPLWRMPLWQPYNTMIKSNIGDIVNTGGPQAGSVTAALFLEHFVPRDQAWIHIDLFAWNPKAKPGRPEGGEAQTLRAVVGMVEEHARSTP